METKSPPSAFIAGLKLELPNISDEIAIDIFNKAIQKNPNLVAMDPLELGTNVAKATKSSMEQYSKSPESGPINTELKDPMAGTQMAQRNAQNPTAEWIDQFDPQSVDKARKEYERLYNERLGERNLSAGSAALTGNTGIMEQSRKSWDAIDKENAAATQGLLEKKQTAATAGDALATSVQNRAKTAGEYQLKQSEGQQNLLQGIQKTASGGIELEQQRMLTTPGSRQAKLAYLQMVQEANAAGRKLPEGMSGDTHSVKDMWPYMTGKMQESYKQLLDAAKVKTEVTAAERGEAMAREGRNMEPAPSAYATPTGNVLPPTVPPKTSATVPPTTPPATPPAETAGATFNFTPGTTDAQLATYRRVLETNKTTAPGTLEAFDKQFPQVKKPSTAIKPDITFDQSSADAKMKQLTSGATPEDIQSTKDMLAGKPSPTFSKITRELDNPPKQVDNYSPEYILERHVDDLSHGQNLERKALTATDPARVIELRKLLAQHKGEPYYKPLQTRITGINGTNVGMGVEGANSSKAQTDAIEHQLSQYSNGGKQAAQYALKNSHQAGLYPENALTAGNPQAQQFAITIDKLNQDLKTFGIVAGGSGDAGGLLSAGGSAIAAGAANPALRVGGAAMSALGGVLGDSKALSTKSDKQTVEKYSIVLQEVAEKKQMLLAQQMAYADQRNGDSSGFINSPEYKAIQKAKPVINPATREVRVPLTSEDRLKLKREGFGDAELFLRRK